MFISMVGRVGVVGGSMVDSMVSMVDWGMVDSMVGWGMVDSMVSITKIDVRVGSSSVDSMVDRCSMVDRVVDSMVDSRVGRGMVDLVDRMVGSSVDSMYWVVVDIVDKMGLVDNNRGSNLNLDFARDGFNISNRGLLDNSWSGCKVESRGNDRGGRKGCGYWEGYGCGNGGKLGKG